MHVSRTLHPLFPAAKHDAYMSCNAKTSSVPTQHSSPGELLLSFLFILIQLTSFSETELLWQINNLKSHMH